MFDLLITGGTVVDGTGAPGFRADVAISGDEIVAIGRLETAAATTIDASGMVVSPGFIDLHSHSDFNFFVEKTADSKILQGVTLEYVGNCGLSMCAPLIGASTEELQIRLARFETDWEPTWTDFGGYLEALSANGSTLNIAAQVGHGTVRQAVLGNDTRAPDSGEIRQMQALVADALDAGAMGLSSGLSMAPGVYSLNSEVISLVEMAAQRGKLYSSHVRDSSNEGPGLLVAAQELIEAGRRTGARLQYSHLKANGSMRGRGAQLVGMIDSARAEGIDIAADQYPYIAASGRMSANILPRWVSAGGRDLALERLSDADLRAEIREGLDEGIQRVGGAHLVTIASYPVDRRHEGLQADEIADEMGTSPPEALLRLFEKYDPPLIMTGMAQSDVDLIGAVPWVAVGSDGTSVKVEPPLNEGKPHPRSYGTFPRFFKTMVTEASKVTLEDAVRKMTTLPAERLNLTRRGRLAPGYLADVTVFDAGRIQDHATFADPHRHSTGIEHVLVNGQAVVSAGESNGATPGRVITGFDQ
jgi:N-acyl-D-amino-acid deacylase